MMTDKKEPTSEFFNDAFKEIGNIGAGHAATALSQMLNRRIDISVPRLTIIKLQDKLDPLYDSLPIKKDANLGIVYTMTSGDLEVDLLTVIPETGIIKFLNLVTYSKVTDVLALTEFEKSSLKEIGNILLLHYISAMNVFISSRLFIYPRVPEIALGSTIEVIETVFDKYLTEHDKEILSIDVDILVDEDKIDTSMLLVPSKETLENITAIFFG
ncbi:MAG: chemotaxis protein CheC [Candidatus Odinarchaeota archaeon]